MLQHVDEVVLRQGLYSTQTRVSDRYRNEKEKYTGKGLEAPYGRLNILPYCTTSPDMHGTSHVPIRNLKMRRQDRCSWHFTQRLLLARNRSPISTFSPWKLPSSNGTVP